MDKIKKFIKAVCPLVPIQYLYHSRTHAKLARAKGLNIDMIAETANVQRGQHKVPLRGGFI